MSIFEETERKEKPETKEIVEKLDFQQIVWMQVNDCRILHIRAQGWNGEDLFARSFFHSTLGLANLLCGITDEDFENKKQAIIDEFHKDLKQCHIRNKKENTGQYDPNYTLYGYQIFRLCMKFIHEKGLGFTELKKEKI
jgi:hypothetical protein